MEELPRIFIDIIEPEYPEPGDVWYCLGVERVWGECGWDPPWQRMPRPQTSSIPVFRRGRRSRKEMFRGQLGPYG